VPQAHPRGGRRTEALDRCIGVFDEDVNVFVLIKIVLSYTLEPFYFRYPKNF
jgi:hypothetical protein